MNMSAAELIAIILLVSAGIANADFITLFLMSLASSVFLAAASKKSEKYSQTRKRRKFPVLIVWSFAILFILQLFIGIGSREGYLLFRLGPLTARLPGLLTALSFVLRAVYVITLFSYLSLRYEFSSAALAVEELLAPLSKIGLKPELVSQSIAIALGFIPVMLKEADRLKLAQRARGGALPEKGALKRARSLIPLVVPLFLQAMARAEQLAVSMDARGFGLGLRHRESLAFSSKEKLTVVLSAFCLGLSIAASVVRPDRIVLALMGLN